MIVFLISIIAGSILLAIVYGIVRFYNVPQIPHDKAPSEYGIEFEEIRFPTKNDRSLYGWWIPESLPDWQFLPTLILVHGWKRNVARTLPYIKNLHGKGYNLLAFDSRHHGSSDRDDFSAMPKFSEDISAAVDYLEKRGKVDCEKIGVIGLSIGGAAAIYAASHDYRIKALATVGAFSHPGKIMRHEFSKRHIPFYPLVWLAFNHMERRIGAKFDEFAPVKNIRYVKSNLLLIHGRDDETVPVSHAEYMYAESNPDNTEFWLLERRGHSDCHLEPGFWERVDSFFKRI